MKNMLQPSFKLRQEQNEKRYEIWEENTANVNKKLTFRVFAKLGKFQARLEPERSSREARRPPSAAPPPGRAGHPPGCPGLRLRLHLGSEPSFCCRNFCYIFARIVPAPYLAISCVFFLGLFLPGKLLVDFGAMASPCSPKDKFVVNVINPYLSEVRKHPRSFMWRTVFSTRK